MAVRYLYLPSVRLPLFLLGLESSIVFGMDHSRNLLQGAAPGTLWKKGKASPAPLSVL
jgi:hypothetical protein